MYDRDDDDLSTAKGIVIGIIASVLLTISVYFWSIILMEMFK